MLYTTNLTIGYKNLPLLFSCGWLQEKKKAKSDLKLSGKNEQMIGNCILFFVHFF